MMWTTLIPADALFPLIASGEALVADCRFDLFDPAAGARAYAAGHLPGAVFLDMERDLSGPSDGSNGRHPLPDRVTLAQRLAEAGLNLGQQVIAYDDVGGAGAARLWWLLRWLRHEAVAVLDGGMQAWKAAGGAVETGSPTPPIPGDFVAAAAAGMPTLDADAVAAHPGPIFDARAPDRFAGAANPLDPRAGHIPGARNRFFRDNLDAGGRFKPGDALAAEYRALLQGRTPGEAVIYCGSGVTAAHDLLAMAHAGLPGAALYPGSWSEWASDPARPIET